MPILDDIMDHDLIGPAIRKGIKQGLKQGVEQGIRQGVEQGIQRGELAILRGMIDKRFGSLPAWVDERLTKLSTAELEELSLRFIDAKSVDELFSS
jgi:flagellar biosynthesis/type III secretory pathway protein FliH